MKWLLYGLMLAGLTSASSMDTPVKRNHNRHRALANRNAQRSAKRRSSTHKATPRATCAPTYASRTIIKGPGSLPVPSTFVTRSGSKLMLGKSVYRPVGANIYWLAVDENVGPPSYTDHGRVREALALAVAMGSNSVRCQSCGISVGSSYSIWPSPNNPNEEGFRAVDYAVAAARAYGQRLIIPLTDQYAVLNRVNVYTGVRYGSDPTILAWETGNELGAYNLQQGVPPAAWTAEIAGLIKSLAPQQLVIDGSDGVFNPSTHAVVPGSSVSAVDILSDHEYPPSTSTLSTDVKDVTQAKKGLVIGEYDWRISGLNTWLNSADSAGSGYLFWSLFGHDAQCCNWVQHNDGYSLYYPNGPNSSGQQANFQPLVTHMWKASQGKSVTYLPTAACPQQPIFNSTVG